MGCDIHLFTERRNGPGQPWVLFPLSLKCGDCHAKSSECGFCRSAGHVIGYPFRNYELFAKLANVRNHSENPWPVIAEPRGWPNDVSRELSAAIDEREQPGFARFNELPGDHSASWFTLAELQSHSVTLREASEYFVDELMVELARYGAPDDVRIVFNFDS